jgi:hypothetical protein
VGERFLEAQRNLSLVGRIGYAYFKSHPFSTGEVWDSNQLIVTFNLNGYIWNPRFVTFSLGANYGTTNYSENSSGYDFKNIGYNLLANFLSGRKINFSLGFGKNEIDFNQLTSESNVFNTQTINKSFNLNVSRIKYLPAIRLSYTDQKYSSGQLGPGDDAERKLNLIGTKVIGKSHFDLNYRFLNRENPFYDINNNQHNLRITERINFDSDTRLYVSTIYSHYSVDLPNKNVLGSESGNMAVSFNKTFSERLSGNVKYLFNLNTGREYSSYSHNMGIRLNFNPLRNLTLTPELNYFTDKIKSQDLIENIREPGAGLRVNYQMEVAKIQVSSSAGFYYRSNKSDLKEDINDLSQSYTISLNAGRRESILGSITYLYDRLEIDSSRTSNSENPFFEGIGRKQNNHYLRLELRSSALRFIDLYLYSQYNTYDREYILGQMMDAHNLTNGIRFSLRRISFDTNYGISRLRNQDITADYESYSMVLNARFFRGLNFRAQNVKRTRTDITFLGDYEWFQEAHLRYNIGRFSIMAIYRRRRAMMQGVNRDDEGITLRFSRSFGVIF